MKEETYKKAMHRHQEKIADYADKMHDIALDMLGDGCSANEVIGLLDSLKMYVFDKTVRSASMELLSELLDSIADDEEE